jgi:hypothetical protein
MKLVDIKKSLPGFFTIKQTWSGRKFAWVSEVVETTAWNSRNPTKKLETIGVKLDENGRAVADPDSYSDKLMPGQISEAVSRQHVTKALIAEQQFRNRKNYESRMYEAHADAFLMELANAFHEIGTDAIDRYDGVLIPKRAIVKWAEGRGLTINNDRTDEEV